MFLKMRISFFETDIDLGKVKNATKFLEFFK